MTIKALPSYYAGIKFRSRLEARWAWVFDRLGLSWQYEPSGYALSNGWWCSRTSRCGCNGRDGCGLSDCSDCMVMSDGQCHSHAPCGDVGTDLPDSEVTCWHTNYLPDFYVAGMWLEVKGVVTAPVVQTMTLASLDGRGGLPLDPHGTVPTDDSRNAPRIILVGRPTGGTTTFAFHKGDVHAEMGSIVHEDDIGSVHVYSDSSEWMPGWLGCCDREDCKLSTFADDLQRRLNPRGTVNRHERDVYHAAERLRFDNGRLAS